MNTDDALALFPGHKAFFVSDGEYEAYQGDKVFIARTFNQEEYLTVSNDSCTKR